VSRWTGIGKIPKLPPESTRAIKWTSRDRYDIELTTPVATVGPIVSEDLRSEEEKELARRIGDKNARSVMRLREKGIVGTSPELLVYQWLTKEKLPFEYQSSQMGGRLQLGGVVVDFLLGHTPGLIALQVQGEYWHKSSAEDAAGRTALLGQRVGGRTIKQVVSVWENDVYDRLERTMTAAIMGREIRAR